MTLIEYCWFGLVIFFGAIFGQHLADRYLIPTMPRYWAFAVMQILEFGFFALFYVLPQATLSWKS